jgi:poly(hydroxyalkanoate) granule-associated protein
MSKKNEKVDKALIDIKDMEKNVSETARQIWLAGLGALATAKDEGTKLYDTLIEKGAEFEKKGKKEIESLMDSVKTMAKETESSVTHKVTDTIDDTIKRVLERFDIPSRDEVKTLISKVETLAKKVEDLTKKAPAEKPVA